LPILDVLTTLHISVSIMPEEPSFRTIHAGDS